MKVMEFSITAKLTLFITTLVVLTSLAISYVYSEGSADILMDKVVSNLEQEVYFLKEPLTKPVKQMQDDTYMISQLPPVQGIIRAQNNKGFDPKDHSTDKEWMKRLSIIFQAILKTRPYYSQIRYIGIKDNGKEILRLQRNGENIERVPEDKLQSRNNRDYFAKITKLNPDETYLSEINLYRDQYDKVYEPYDLVVRAAVPVFSEEDNTMFGFIIINASYNKIMEELSKHKIDISETLYVANQDGDYLFNNDYSKLYATDLGHNYRVQKDYPSLFESLKNNNITAKTILPSDSKGNVLSFLKYHYDSANPERYMVVFLKIPYEVIIGRVREIRQNSYMAAFAIALVTALFAILFLRFLLLPLNIIAHAVVSYRKGNKNVQLPIEQNDEIGLLAREFKEMVKIKNNEDWIKENLLNISKEMLGLGDLKLFADNLIQKLTPLSGAQAGVFYIDSGYLNTESELEKELLFLGAYSYVGAGSIPPVFKWGEGVIGQCAKSNEQIIIRDVKKEDLRISSAISESKPYNLLILPVLLNNKSIAVIELASTTEFSDVTLEFLKQVSFNAGIVINSISSNMRTEELLEESRATTEELRRNEEELKAQQEELQAFNEEMQEKAKALEEQNQKIQNQSEELEENRSVIIEKVRELEMSNKYKSEFLANISHELRTPLNSLLILSKSLHSNEEKNLTDEQVEELGIIYNGGMDLLNLINDILDLSKVEAGKMSVVPSDITIQEIADDMKNQFVPVASEANVKFNIEVTKDTPVSIYTDGQRLEQILKNLLSNAFKFTERGEVSLKVFVPAQGAMAQHDGMFVDNIIAFKVTDTGIGIAQNKLSDIFEAFQQEDGSTDRHYGGTGLGLTISRKFAYLLGGEIQVESKKGQGSSFTVLIPQKLLDNNNKNASTQNQTKISEPNRKISIKSLPTNLINEKQVLIIEDDKDFAKVLSKQAQERGYKSIIAHNGKMGLLKAVEQGICAIILDLRLPDIDGEVVLNQLKSNEKLRNIPVHIITGKADNDNNSLVEKGAIACLTKPLNQQDIDSIFSRIEAISENNIKEVLVIEDDKKTQAAIKKLIGKKDINITIATRGKDALNLINKNKYDCAILDMNLPDMDGFKWLSQLEKINKLQTVPPIVIYTAKELTEAENGKLSHYTGSIVIKGVSASERLLDEVTLFLHSIGENNNNTKMYYDNDNALQGRKILLADDDMRNCFAISKILKKQGMRVIIADNGAMAIEKLEQDSSIEMVIMDIMMPVMDGYEAIKNIRKWEKFKKLPIIALTARAMPEEQDKCIEAGSNDYMTKPVDMDKLITLIRLWLFKQGKVA